MLKAVSTKTKQTWVAAIVMLAIELSFMTVTAADADTDKHQKAQVVSAQPALPKAFSKGMFVFLNGDRTVSTDSNDGVIGVTVLVDGEAVQFDLPTYAMEHLMSSGVNPGRISHVFFTHLHWDHIMGYPEFAFMRSVWAQGPINVLGPEGTQNMVAGAAQFNAVHITALPEYVENTATDHHHVAANVQALKDTLSAKVTEITAPGVILETERFTVTAATVLHSVPSFAYRVDSQYGSVVISGDTAPSLNVLELAQDVDLLIHEATMTEAAARARKMIRLDDGLRSEYDKQYTGHTSALELGKIAQRAKAKKLVAYHLRPFVNNTATQALLGNPTGFPKQEFGTAKNDFIAEVKRHYQGPLFLAEPTMVFRIGVDN